MSEKQTEHAKLVEKRRLLMKKVQTMEAEITRKRQTIADLEQDLQHIWKQQAEAQEHEDTDSGKPAGEQKLPGFLQDLCLIVSSLVKDDACIQSKYSTPSSALYVKIEKEVFEGYITRLSRLELKEFTDTCAKLEFIKTQQGRYIFPSGNKRVYYLSKKIVEEMEADNQ